MIVSSKHRDIRVTDHRSIIIFTGFRLLIPTVLCCDCHYSSGRSVVRSSLTRTSLSPVLNGYKVDNFLEAPAGFESCQWLVAFWHVVLSKILNIREIEDVSFRVIYRLTAVHLLKKGRKGEL